MLFGPWIIHYFFYLSFIYTIYVRLGDDEQSRVYRPVEAPDHVICSMRLNFGLNISNSRDEQNMRKLARNPILRRMTQKVTFYETVCNKMLGVCTPNWWTAPYFSEFTRFQLTFELFCFFQKWCFRGFLSTCKNRI